MLNAEEGDEDALAITYSPVVQIKFLVDLKKGRIEVYNDHASQDQCRILLANVHDRGVDVNDFLLAIETQNRKLSKEKRKQSIVYYNGRDKAIRAAYSYYERVKPNGPRKDPLLEALSKDIQEEVHQWYYLAEWYVTALLTTSVIFRHR